MEATQTRKDGKKQLAIRLTPSKIKTLKQYALNNDITVTETIEKALNEMLARENVMESK